MDPILGSGSTLSEWDKLLMHSFAKETGSRRNDEPTRTVLFCQNSLKQEAQVTERHRVSLQNQSERLVSLRWPGPSVEWKL